MTRPAGVSAGGAGLVAAWVGGATIARLTGATPVVIVLAAGAVLFAVAAVVGPLRLRAVKIRGLQMPSTVTQGEPFTLSLDVDGRQPVWIEVRSAGHVVAGGWASAGRFVGEGVMCRRGVIDSIEVGARSAGAVGLVWWVRRFEMVVPDIQVAARSVDGDVAIVRTAHAEGGDAPGRSGAISGEIDGVRPWREGDSEKFVHWASTVRAGELVVHDRRGDSAEAWVVRARPGLPDPDREAGAVRSALEHGLRSAARVGVAIGDGAITPIPDDAAAARWSAQAELGQAPEPARPRRWWGRATEPETTATVLSRWWAAAATFVSLAMLSSALDYGIVVTLLAAAGTAAGAAVSARSLTTGEQPSAVTRAAVGAGALVALLMVVAGSGRLNDLIGFMRGPLAQVLIVLIVLHGFECHDRRTIRVGLGISSIVVMYASGFRVDDALGWWLAVWGACFGIALSKLSSPTPTARSGGRHGSGGLDLAGWLPRAATLGAGTAATVAILAVVPVPTGPVNLTLPTFIESTDDVAFPGAVAGPGGDIRSRDVPASGEQSRGPAGQAGGYTGFAAQMDTSVRGELGDEVVMRVRAPEPDFWRGQTFAEFDGRRWYADVEPGVRREGPSIDVPSALGDVRLADDVAIEQFVQTYYLEVDMPNLVFHAGRPVQLIIDTDVFTRSDGALRAATVLPQGSIYTVVSSRARVDADLLERQGLIGQRLTELGRQALGRYLELPASTSQETIDLASELARGRRSTYDVVRAYEQWMTENVEYDLDAPLPDDGEDAVHDLLFDSQLGFCEQIASSLTIMLRTQGVPARLVTGYLPGTRDRIAGVFEVKSSDAHAWVEVWFPESGWQAFDPTAAVPLSADSKIDSIGADLVGGAAEYVSAHRSEMLLAALLGVLTITAAWTVLQLRHRRRRGRWGLLQDRFRAAATRRGAAPGSSNPKLAKAWSEADGIEAALVVAERLDRVAFDPTFTDDAGCFDETRKLVGALPRPPR